MVAVLPKRTAAATSSSARRHIVDALIEERAPGLAASPFWPLLRPALYSLLDYAKARDMADAIAPLSGREALDRVSGLLSLKMRARGLERVPPKGRLIVVVNHPTGVADGIAIYDALKAARPDVIFFANADAFRVCPGFADVLIPVEWVEEKRTRERNRQTLQLALKALEAERAVVIFPAGRLARRRAGVLTDPPWAPSAVSLARRHQAPILPIHLAGPRSTLFHLFDRISSELRDITLFHEILNKRGGRYDLIIGPAIEPGALDGDAGLLTARLKAHVERALPRDPRSELRMILPAEGDFDLPDEAATARLGHALAGALKAKEALCLKGVLGAGKTTLARALIRACDRTADEAPSPTFTLVQYYEGGDVPLAHFDLYRLTSAEEVAEIGLDEALADGAAIIEWPERLGRHLPRNRLDIEMLIIGEGGRERRLARLTPHGSWEGRPLEF